MVTATLDGMAAGGLYDVVGGGFHRYSVDERWLVPHFERDALRQRRSRLDVPARLARNWASAVPGDRGGDDQYLVREMLLPDGAFASAQDADTDGVEGLTYTWSERRSGGLRDPDELLQPFEHGRFIVRGELEPGAP